MSNSMLSFQVLLLFFWSYWANSSLSALFFFFVFTLATVFFLDQHLTIVLIQLECLTLMVFTGFIWSSSIDGLDLLILFSVIVVAVIEAALGLSVVVKLTRSLAQELLKFQFLRSTKTTLASPSVNSNV